MSLFTFGSGSGTHALVVGVGHYPALLGGGGPLYDGNGGMGQLTSAPNSALAFAEWLTKSYKSASAPLKSMELLVSRRKGVQFQNHDIDKADFSHFKKAVLAWRERLNHSQKNRGIFYFCGHGVSSGVNDSLLLGDYGVHPATALASALDFTVFHKAMDQCKAREQLYVVDACRVIAPSLIYAAGVYGDPILTPGKPTQPPRKPPVCFSALEGTAAYGQEDKPSFFTEALLKALKGSGAGKKNGKWAILPSVLYRAMERLLEKATGAAGVTQACTLEPLVDFPLHELVGPPEVPVTIECRSPIDSGKAMLKFSSNGKEHEPQQPPLPKPYCVDLPLGQYQFTAVVKAKKWETEAIVYPPYTDVELP